MDILKKILFIIIIFFLFFIPTNNQVNFVFPTDYTEISSNYGNRNIFGSTYFHNGIDFLAPYSSKVYACTNGIVIDKGFSSSYGNFIILQHSNSYKSLYGHLDENFIVNIGDYVYSNQYIANVGPKYLSNGSLNGLTTGPHLHFTIFNEENKTIDPINILKKDSSIY